MNQQNIHLEELPLIYKTLEGDKKIFSLKALDFILELNKQVGFDDILIKSGYQNYPNKKQFEKKKTFPLFQQFFSYLNKNLSMIESTYLKESNDKKVGEQTSRDNQTQYNYLASKNSISKFIQDEAIHYQQVLDKYLKKINGGQLERGVKTGKLHNLFIELFNSNYIKIIIANQVYLNRSVGQIEVDLGITLIEYAKQIKSKSQEEAKKQFVILQEQILDFLTFWLKEKSKDNVYVLYARTKQRLDQQQKFLISKSQATQKVHPSQMTIQQISNTQQKIQKSIQSIVANKQQIIKQIGEQQVKQEIKSQIQPKQFNIKSQIRRTEQNQAISSIQFIKNTSVKTARKKEELLNLEIKKLFKFGCQRRYKLDKNSTFQQIEQSTRTMDLQKFLYFCNFFELLSFVNRQKAIQFFKVQSVSRLIDFLKFQEIIKKMIAINPQIIDNLLNKKTFQGKKKTIMIHKDKRLERLSQYKFVLRPVNGMDISTIQKQLTHRKLHKLASKEEKGKIAFDKREAEKEVKEIKKSNSQFGNKLTALDLESIRDSSFNPEKLLISEQDHDKLWEDYQAKIWKKQQTSNNILESILSKRIARGTRIIDKINSQISFVYD